MQTNDSNVAASELSCIKRGMPNDPEIRLGYPETSVVCYQPAEPASISIEHQTEFCLCDNFVNCPVYQRKAAVPPPAEVPGGFFVNISAWVLLPIVLIGLGIGAVFFLSPNSSIAGQGEDPTATQDPAGSGVITETIGIDPTTTDLDSFTPTRPSLFPTLAPVDVGATSTATPTKLPTATRTVRPTRTPRPTSTPPPTATATATRDPNAVVAEPATATPNYLATQSVRDAAATADANNTAATWTANNARMTVEAQQTSNAAAANASVRAQQTTNAANAQATTAAEATRRAWNGMLTQTAEAAVFATPTPPASDRDGDGIADELDACPDQYGIPDYNGCNPFEDDGGGDGGGSDDGRD